MFCNIAPICSGYRGIERSVDVSRFKSNDAKHYKEIINMYFDYLKSREGLFSKNQVVSMIEFANYFSQNSDDTYEVIVYNDSQLLDLFDFILQFLGIDVLHSDVEPLLLEPQLQQHFKKYRNNNGLLKSVDEANTLCSPNLIEKYGKLRFLWVYTILSEKPRGHMQIQ